MAKCSHNAALRDIKDLLNHRVLRKTEGAVDGVHWAIGQQI
jgi:hypothetical protein